ncbi:PLAC8-like protein 1 isoform X2 [Hemicordylus capensis]|uniref:PLAC8-like protein 1 isoform X2 n=1 Tax=Hemicordylus capensis TaxID=884348 RepID=UPI002304C5DD|nr:PLAC8-like protein 1 isoform X2 [Hemicordylus capensis]
MDQLGSFCCNATKNNVLTNTTQSPLILSPPASEEWNVFLSMMGSKTSTEPIMTQPTPGAATSRITTMVRTGGNWSTGLFDVCSDKRVCVCGSLCSPCLECSLASRYGECFCFPLLLGSTLALRAGTRERYKIRGTLCEDWMAVHCCWPFAVCQIAREMKRRPILQVYETHTSPPPLLSVKDALV